VPKNKSSSKCHNLSLGKFPCFLMFRTIFLTLEPFPCLWKSIKKIHTILFPSGPTCQLGLETDMRSHMAAQPTGQPALLHLSPSHRHQVPPIRTPLPQIRVTGALLCSPCAHARPASHATTSSPSRPVLSACILPCSRAMFEAASTTLCSGPPCLPPRRPHRWPSRRHAARF
jgi:hypothetical protein